MERDAATSGSSTRRTPAGRPPACQPVRRVWLCGARRKRSLRLQPRRGRLANRGHDGLHSTPVASAPRVSETARLNTMWASSAVDVVDHPRLRVEARVDRLVQALEVLRRDRKVGRPLRVLENGRRGRARPGPRVLGARRAMSGDANEATQAHEAAKADEATHGAGGGRAPLVRRHSSAKSDAPCWRVYCEAGIWQVALPIFAGLWILDSTLVSCPRPLQVPARNRHAPCWRACCRWRAQQSAARRTAAAPAGATSPTA